jgi:UDP:flavonoid glycosyltransferase YjiC (YdhE family)
VRVLFTCVPGFGHFYPMVPLAQAMREAGHEVGFATAARFCRNVIAPTGFRAFPAGLSPLQAQERLRSDHRWGAGTLSGPHQGALLFAGPAATAKAADLTQVIRGWAPELVVHDAVDFGAPLAASAAGLAYASHSLGALQPTELWDLAGLVVEPAWRERGMEPAHHGGIFRYLYLDICPPRIQSPDIFNLTVARPMRPVIFDSPRPPPVEPWVAAQPQAPTIYVSMGTVFNTTPGLFETVLGALADEGLDVIATVGLDREPSELGPQPTNVHVTRFLPQSVVLPRCDAVVCHGGSGTTLAALAHGLPLLILPQGANQTWYAHRCAAVGAATTLEKTEVTRAAVREKVKELLDQARYREEAQALQREIAQMPSPEETVAALEALA